MFCPISVFRSAVLAVGFLLITPFLATAAEPEAAGTNANSTNPILPGYYADPSIVEHNGKAYLYVTLDPWGGETLGCWESDDYSNWTYRALNWPTKAACQSAESSDATVWAPSVIRGPDGRFHMAVSVGSEVWIGVADHPLGPWRNALEDRPLIGRNYRPGFHMIDAEYFIDDDGSVFLYWGSGLNWVNGRCWVAKLTEDLSSFDGDVREVTPSNYFEAPLVVKRHGLYFLMYSSGKTTIDTYQVHYAVGKSPLGPFKEGPNSPILISNHEQNVLGPGHHAVLRHDNADYILYHRHSIPFDPDIMGRQVCMDPLTFSKEGVIETVTPSHNAPAWVKGRDAASQNWIATDSGHRDGASPGMAIDNNYATRWTANDAQGWIQLDLGELTAVQRHTIRPEYAWKPYRFRVEASRDGAQWEVVADHTAQSATGSPIIVDSAAKARYFRLVFPGSPRSAAPSLIEWSIR